MINKAILDGSLNKGKVDFSDDQTEKDIGWMVGVRNAITHSISNKSENIPNSIFNRLELAVYCSVLERAGYQLNEIENIIEPPIAIILYYLERIKIIVYNDGGSFRAAIV